MELLLFMSGIVVVGVLLVLGIVSVCLGFVVYDRTRDTARLAAHLSTIEGQLKELKNDLGFDPMDGATPFRSIDGKYTASSLEELVQKMAQGGDIDLDPNDPELLKKFFEQLTNDEDEDGDEKKPWEK